jgi:sensor domain CHASE-containing protein
MNNPIALSAISAVIVALISGIVGWRRNRADTTERITAAAANLSTHFNTELLRQARELANLRERVDELETEAAREKRWRMTATSYFHTLFQFLRERNIPFPRPPAELGLLIPELLEEDPDDQPTR